jgi:hypothetical protein
VVDIQGRVDAAIQRAVELQLRLLQREGELDLTRVAAVRTQAAELRAEHARLAAQRSRAAGNGGAPADDLQAQIEHLNQLTAQLEEALDSRGVIERAKGILMVVRRCSADEAFNLLRRQSQQDNVKLRLVAQRVVDSVEESAKLSRGPTGVSAG